MANKLISKTAKKIAKDYCRLSIVRNLDGFLAMDDVRRELFSQMGLNVIVGNPIQLRIHFELTFKQETDKRFVYISNDLENIVPDMAEEAFVADFNIGELFPFLADKSILKGMDLEQLSTLNERCGIRRISIGESLKLVNDVKKEIEDRRRKSADHFRQQIENIVGNAHAFTDIDIHEVADCMVDAIANGNYSAIEPKIEEINNLFQHWIDDSYFATLNSNHLLCPKSVNKILPYLADNHDEEEKIALLVIDGLAYWQFVVLQRYLAQNNIRATSDRTLAWIPTITMLSRQAIFRGETPKQEYKQSTDRERLMWRDFWEQKGMANYSIQYISDKDEFAVNEGVSRLAYVTVEMDEKMHSSTDYHDLLSLTENWCPRITEKIRLLQRMDFKVYITSDHGSVLSHGWQPISAVEKVFLYKDGSRGKRHLIYNNVENQQSFYAAHNLEITMLRRENWLVVRSNACFERGGHQTITHGGSHFWEVVIPFATIE